MENSGSQIIKMKELPQIITSEVTPDLPAPPEGKVWRRKYDGLLFYGNVYLGLRYYSSKGKLLKNPIKEKPNDYEIVDEPINEDLP